MLQGKDFQKYRPNVPRSPPKPSLVDFLCVDQPQAIQLEANSQESTPCQELVKAQTDQKEKELIAWLKGAKPSPAVRDVALKLTQCCHQALMDERRDHIKSLFKKMKEAYHSMMEPKFKETKPKARAYCGVMSMAAARERFMVKAMLEQPQGDLIAMLSNELVAGGSGPLALCARYLPSGYEILPITYEAAAEVCVSILSHKQADARSAKAVELLLQLALVRGSVRDVVVAVLWLMQVPPYNPPPQSKSADGFVLSEWSQSMWKLAEELHSIWAPWGEEVLKEGTDQWVSALVQPHVLQVGDLVVVRGSESESPTGSGGEAWRAAIVTMIHPPRKIFIQTEYASDFGFEHGPADVMYAPFRPDNWERPHPPEDAIHVVLKGGALGTTRRVRMPLAASQIS